MCLGSMYSTYRVRTGHCMQAHLPEKLLYLVNRKNLALVHGKSPVHGVGRDVSKQIVYTTSRIKVDISFNVDTCTKTIHCRTRVTMDTWAIKMSTLPHVSSWTRVQKTLYCTVLFHLGPRTTVIFTVRLPSTSMRVQ